MKRSSLLFFALFCLCLQPFSSMAQAQQAPGWEWVTPIQSLSFEDGVFPGQISMDAQENIWIGGGFTNQVVLGPDTLTVVQPPLPYNIINGFLAQYNNQGAYQSSVHVAGYNSQVLALAHDGAGSTYALGYSADSAGVGNLFLSKSNSGSFIWTQVIPYTNPTLDGIALAVTPAGEVYAIASFIDSLTIGGNTLISAGFQDVFLAKYSTVGQLQWVKQGGGPLSDFGMSLGIAPGGGCYVTGTFSGTAQFEGQQLLSQGDQDVFIAHYDQQGTLTWIEAAGGTGLDRPMTLAVSPNGNVLVAGMFQGSAYFGNQTLGNQGNDDLFVSAWAASGQPLWAKSGGTASFDFPSQIATDSLNNLYLLFRVANAGFIYNQLAVLEAQAEADYLMKLNPAGDITWVKRIGDAGGSGMIRGYGLAVTAGGKSYITGGYNGTAVFNGTVLPATQALGFNGIVAALSATVVGLPEAYSPNQEQIVLSPNPATDKVYVTLPANSYGPITIALRSITGQEISTKTVSGAEEIAPVNITGLAPGMYFISLRDQSGIRTGKLVVN